MEAGYIKVPLDMYTKLVENAARYDLLADNIPEEWPESVLDVFVAGLNGITIVKRDEYEKKRKADAKKNKCPDPGKLKSLMYAGWRATDISEEMGAPIQDIYEWMAEAIRADMDLPAAFRMDVTKLEGK